MVVQWLGFCGFSAECMGSVQSLVREHKIPSAVQCPQIKKKKKKIVTKSVHTQCQNRKV